MSASVRLVLLKVTVTVAPEVLKRTRLPDLSFLCLMPSPFRLESTSFFQFGCGVVIAECPFHDFRLLRLLQFSQGIEMPLRDPASGIAACDLLNVGGEGQ